MDAIMLRQIDEALGYDKHMNAMVFTWRRRGLRRKSGRCLKTTTR